MWQESQRRAYEAYWPDVDRLFSSLPPRLFRQAKLLEYDLAFRYSATGQFSQAFQGPDQFPILSLAGWLLDDLGVPTSDRADIDRRLFLVSLLLAARVQAIEAMHDPSSFSDESQVGLVEFLPTRIHREFAHLIPNEAPGSPFWAQYEALTARDVDRLLESRKRQTGTDPDPEPDAYLDGRWSAPARLLALAATEIAGAAPAVPGIGSMLDGLAAAFQIRDDVETMHRDLQHEWVTYPIAVVARAAHIPLRPPPEPNRVLGAMVATRSLPTILATAEALVSDSAQCATELGLGSVRSYLDDARAIFAEQLQRVSAVAATEASAKTRSAPLMRTFEPTLPKALDMAQRFLLSERSFRESWETHREGMLGAPEVASRYPAGLILEILQGRGADVTREIDDFLSFTFANGFRYYHHPWSDPDSDTVGVFLRLRAHAKVPDQHDKALARILVCLERQVQATGAIPVWITGCDGDEDSRPPILALGEGCGTVAAHLLIGLLTATGDRYRAAVETGTAHLLARLTDVGLGANVNYPLTYALAVYFRLLKSLDHSDPRLALAEEIGQTRARLMAELETLVATRMVTPQDAALATICCRDAERPDLVDRRWLTTVLKGQRSDGSWIGEPFAAEPNRGGWVSWYSSTMLTSALCYDALCETAGQSANP